MYFKHESYTFKGVPLQVSATLIPFKFDKNSYRVTRLNTLYD